MGIYSLQKWTIELQYTSLILANILYNNQPVHILYKKFIWFVLISEMIQNQIFMN